MTLQDGGERKVYPSGAVKEPPCVEKGRYDLIPPGPLHRLAVHYARGAEKYPPGRTWEAGLPWSVLIGSALRHTFQWLSGARDEDHLAAAVWQMFALMDGETKHPECCDVPSRGVEKGQIISNLAAKTTTSWWAGMIDLGDDVMRVNADRPDAVVCVKFAPLAVGDRVQLHSVMTMGELPKDRDEKSVSVANGTCGFVTHAGDDYAYVMFDDYVCAPPGKGLRVLRKYLAAV